MYPWYPTHPDTVYVDDDYDNSTPGWGYDRFNRIQYGINEVEGSTVYVYSGIYNERIRINKSINLIGEDKNTTIIDGDKVSDVTIRIFVDNVNISGFTIQESGDGYSGVCTYANNTTISNNIVKSNGYHGITVRNSSSNNIISNNIILDNEQNGINLQDSSSNNIIYHNNLINNTQNGYDENTNTWDNGYPSGGNYWSDYTGDDLYSGPNQNIPGRDGIGDTPYNILGGDNQDMYPCMEPNGWINSPPNVPDRPSGEVIILPGVAYTYTTSTIDPDDDSIWFKWDWGDGTFSDWLGPYDSEEEASESHIWSQGTYEVTVKAKDSRNPETDWSAPLTVNAIFPNLKTVLLFGFITNLSTSTDYNSFNVVKLLWIGFNPIFPEILSSNEVIVISDKFFGILRPSFIFGFFKAMVLA